MASKSKGYLDRDAIMGASDIESEDVYVPQWGGTVRVQGLTAADRDAFEQSMIEGRGKNQRMNLVNFRARLVALTVVDGDGKRLFTDEDVKALGAKSAGALDTIFTVAQKLSGLGDDDVEELTANFNEAGGGGSSSTSPAS